MIWRPTLTHQDYMKYDIQSMTTKFSVRPSVGKTKKMKQSSSTLSKTTNKQHQHQCHHPKHDSDRITAIEIEKSEKEKEKAKVKDNMNEDDFEDDDDTEEEEDDDDNTDTTKQLTMTNNETNNQGVFLNFSYDLSPQSVSRKRKKTTVTAVTTTAKSKKAAYRVNGVNILNRKNLDSKTAIERLQRRRENHNHVERRRRDTINNIIYELSQVVPLAIWSGKKPHKGNILKATLDYILTLQEENRIYKEKLNTKNNNGDNSSSIPIPAIIQSSTYNNNNISNTALSSPSPLPSSPSTISHSSPFTSINDNPLSPIPVHNDQDKKKGFTFLQMDGCEKAYNNTCHY